MYQAEWTLKSMFLIIVLFLGMITLHAYWQPAAAAAAQPGRFDYVHIISPLFLYKGTQGLLLLDKRNGNVWFIARGDEVNITFRNPVFVVRIPLEKLDAPPTLDAPSY